MILSRQWAFRTGLSMAALALGGLLLGAYGLRVSRAQGEGDPDREIVRHVTVFAVVATPEGKAVDSNRPNIQPHLGGLLPGHGFKLLAAQSARLVAGESV